RNHRARVEVIARTPVRIEIRSRIARAPEHQIRLGVIAARDPRRPAAVPPRIVAPGFGPRLTRRGDRVESPRLFAGLRIECRNEAADSVFGARRPDDDL